MGSIRRPIGKWNGRQMSLREVINQRARVVGPAIVVLGIVAITVSVLKSRRSAPSGPITQGFFSDDDGKTYFADDVNKQFPFDHGGHQAYRAYVFRCRSGGRFVGYLGSFAGADLKKPDDTTPNRDEQFGEQHLVGMQVKKPGDTKWVPLGGPQGDAISNVTCPDGSRSLAVFPSQ